MLKKKKKVVFIEVCSSTYIVELLWGLDELIFVKSLEYCPALKCFAE